MGLTVAALSRFRAATDASHEAVFRERLAVFGELVVFGVGAPIRGLAAKNEFTRELVEGGFADSGNVVIQFMAADIPIRPELGSAATYQSRPFRVARVTFPAGALIGEIELRPARR